MVTLKIDKRVPIPERTNGTRRYPLADMAVGDSFFIPGGKRYVNIAASLNRHRPKTFTTRKCEEQGVSGLRVWRTA